MTGQFQKYSQYYDLIYQSKDYPAETSYIDKILRKSTSKPLKTFLSLGCGTASYEMLLAKKGYQIDGVDLSSTMLGVAKEKISHAKLTSKITLHQGDIRKFSLDKQFDAAGMLFNIVGYMIENQDFENALLNVSKHLKPGGLFVFDCWYTPAVLRDPPTDRVKKISKKDSRVLRLTRSQLNLDRNFVDINFQVLSIKGSKILDEVNENHPMRYFSLPELNYYFTKTGFQLVSAYDWLETTPVTGKKWDIFIVARKI